MSDTVFIPMKLDCFVLNQDVCSGGDDEAKIAPITQPNYTLLRYERQYLESDILLPVDLHSCTPATANPRFTDLGKREPYKNRQGVYVHWMIPRVFRTAAATTETRTTANSKEDPSAATFFDVPVRWLVVRRLDLDSVRPKPSEGSVLPEYKAWVVESDRLRNIDELEENVDLQVDVSPYVSATTDAQGNAEVNIDEQAEVFIGFKEDAETWTEDSSKARVPVNLFNSSNQLFADYQPHNGNVFSMVDQFEYYDANGKEQTMEQATASYHVIGWQTDATKDLFHFAGGDTYTRDTRLSELKMRMEEGVVSKGEDENKGNGKAATWKSKQTATRSLCHGTMYDVVWDAKKKPQTVPADMACQHLMEESPIAVATTPMDAILAYISGHVDEPITPSPEAEAGSGTPVSEAVKDKKLPLREVEKILLKVLTLIQERDEGVESQRKALDTLSNLNFHRLDGGKHFFVADTSGTDTDVDRVLSKLSDNDQLKLTDDTISKIIELNRTQRVADGMDRQTRKKQWDLFSAWWKFLNDIEALDSAHLPDHKHTRDKLVQGTDLVKGLMKTLPELDRLREHLESMATDFTAEEEKEAQVGVMPPFHQAGDPTVLVAGIASGWPLDYAEALKVRLRSQLMVGEKNEESVSTQPLEFALDQGLEKIVSNLERSASFEVHSDDVRYLLAEFVALRSDMGELKAGSDKVLPLYHDVNKQFKEGKVWRDRWNSTQPWFPLFMEWEVEYVHVPWKHWELNNADSVTGQDQGGKLRYRVASQSLGKEDIDGRRTFGGRVLLLPQPTFSLKAKIDQLFAETPPTLLAKALDDNDKAVIKTQLDRLRFLSSPLAGFTQHLVTKLGGTHVKPTYRQPAIGDKPALTAKAIEGAVDAAIDAGYKAIDLEYMGFETDLTPYGTSFRYAEDEPNPFKPVTHGQFRFTKLNIIDKFGQAIHAISPKVEGPSKPLRPYISEYYSPQRLFTRPPDHPQGDTRLARKTTSTRSKDYEFIQVPPQINQFARLNAFFVKPSGTQNKDGSTRFLWEPVEQWENPAWGWMVVNYANYGLQFFLPDGRFYREVRVGGPTGSLESPLWLPEKPSTNDEDLKDAAQLQRLIDCLAGSSKYLQNFIDMVNASMASMMPPQTAYAEFMSSLVGPPLALVNMGLSLELAVEAYSSHAMLAEPQMKTALTPDPAKYPDHSSVNFRDGVGNAPTEDQPDLYGFKVKLGDGLRAYDGLVGYWPTIQVTPTPTGPVGPVPGNALDFSELYTYYGPSTNPIVKISKSNFPVFKPYFIDSTLLPRGDNGEAFASGSNPTAFHTRHCGALQGFGALIDPFTPVHGYSSVLPIVELKLPSWTWQQAFQKMDAFFHLGPLVVTKDVPERPLPPVSKDQSNRNKKIADENKVRIPALALAKPVWLQPYVAEELLDSEGHDNVPLETAIVYGTLDVMPVDDKMRLEDGPYTAVEGYIKLRKPGPDGL